MKNRLLILIIGTFVIINLITLTSCGTTKKVMNKKDFLYMEEVYAYAKKYYKEGDWNKCIEWYQRLEKDYPGNPYMDEVLFMKGYINKNYLKNIDRAEEYFNILIQNYPESEFTASAEFELEHINEPDFVPKFTK